MAKRSAGILLYRLIGASPEVLLVHPGGPFWARKDLGAWSIPKGEYSEAEPPLEAAVRELQEETGASARGPFLDLGSIRMSGGKTVAAWACESDFDPADLVSNICQIEWPPRSGRRMDIPEVDRAAWFSLAEARTRILTAQQPFLDRLAAALDAQSSALSE